MLTTQRRSDRCCPAVLRDLASISARTQQVFWLATRCGRSGRDQLSDWLRQPLVACCPPTCSSSSPSGSRRSPAPDVLLSAPWSLRMLMPSDGRLLSTTAETQTRRRWQSQIDFSCTWTYGPNTHTHTQLSLKQRARERQGRKRERQGGDRRETEDRGECDRGRKTR